MITGDYPATVQSIARQAGLQNCEAVVTGPELDRMSDEELVSLRGLEEELDSGGLRLERRIKLPGAFGVYRARAG